MRNRKPHYLRSLVLGMVFVGLALFGYRSMVVWAEQLGDPPYTPESGEDSRLKQLSDSLETLSYGDPNNGAIGDWGEYWNRISSAAQDPFNDAKAVGLFNGGNADFPQNVGGVHDDLTLPIGSYQSTWTVCNLANDYCGTGNSNAEKRDENTGLVWSNRSVTAANWFTANNCVQPSNGVAPQGPDACTNNGDEGCKCVKLTSDKTGCEALGDGNWRLPYQKEIMMAYIDGSAANLINAAANHWSSTTNTASTQSAWSSNLSNGLTPFTTKTGSIWFRCVR